MSDESTRHHVRWNVTKGSFYAGLSDEDRRLNVEGRLTDVLSKFGGKRLVAGKVMHDLLLDLTNEVFKMKDDGLI